jgi:hypothetical protein
MLSRLFLQAGFELGHTHLFINCRLHMLSTVNCFPLPPPTTPVDCCISYNAHHPPPTLSSATCLCHLPAIVRSIANALIVGHCTVAFCCQLSPALPPTPTHVDCCVFHLLHHLLPILQSSTSCLPSSTPFCCPLLLCNQLLRLSLVAAIVDGFANWIAHQQ